MVRSNFSELVIQDWDQDGQLVELTVFDHVTLVVENNRFMIYSEGNITILPDNKMIQIIYDSVEE